MSEIRVPGMVGRKADHLRVGGVFVLIVALIIAGVMIARSVAAPEKITISMRTESVAGGIQPGSPVVLNGAMVGTVTAIDAVTPTSSKIVLTLERGKVGDVRLLTDAMDVAYAPWNLFGISSVILTAAEGGRQLQDNSTFFVTMPADGTLTTLLRKLDDLDSKALGPHMGDILRQASTITDGVLPAIGVAGTLLQQMTDTQRVPTSVTLPQLAQLISKGGEIAPPLIQVLKRFTDWTSPIDPQYTEDLDVAFANIKGDLFTQIKALLGTDGVAGLIPVLGPLEGLLVRVNQTFPDARRNGVELRTLIDRIRAAMPDGPNGPVLNLDVVFTQVPALRAGLGPQTPNPRQPRTGAPR